MMTNPGRTVMSPVEDPRAMSLALTLSQPLLC
jgi:hypothetical protein